MRRLRARPTRPQHDVSRAFNHVRSPLTNLTPLTPPLPPRFQPGGRGPADAGGCEVATLALSTLKGLLLAEPEAMELLLRVLALCSPSHPTLLDASRDAVANTEAARRQGEAVAHPAAFTAGNALAKARARSSMATMLAVADAMEQRLRDLECRAARQPSAAKPPPPRAPAAAPNRRRRGPLPASGPRRSGPSFGKPPPSRTASAHRYACARAQT